ncbi:MAG: hypothetical protein K0R25_674 [Rickettsiaceae bacterium]|jgi:hypothetical protein|nr:hypothetical protein [Rickettsiaceae bacterium]
MKNLKRLLIILSLLLTISNCTWVGTVKNIRTFDENNKVNIKDSFYLIYPKNGFQKTMITKKLEENHDSAKEVVDVFRSKLSEVVNELSIGDKNIDLNQGFKDADLKGSKYLIDITINEWKDAFYMMCAAPHTGQSYGSSEPVTLDTVDLTIFVYDVKTKSLVNKQRIENRGCPIVFLAFIPVGKNSPSSRLESMIPDWFKNLGI